MEKLHRTVNVSGKVYHDIVKSEEMTEVELFQAIAPFEIPKLREKIDQLQEENVRLKSRGIEGMRFKIEELKAELAEAKPVLDAAMNYAQAEGWLDKSKNIEHCGTEGCFHCELGLAVRKFKEK